MKKIPNKYITVLILVGLILASGLIVPQAYIKYLNSREFRPPFEKGLTKNIQLLDDKRGVISLSVFQGHIWLAYCTSHQPENANELIHRKVSALRNTFPEETIKACIFLVEATENDAEMLKAYRAQHAPLLSDDDYIVSANVKVVQKYLKNEFRFGLLPYEKEGKWIYDSDLIILDQLPDKNGAVLSHMRGHLDFKKAADLDQEAIKGGTVAMYESKLDEHLRASIQYLIDNPNEEDPALKGEE